MILRSTLGALLIFWGFIFFTKTFFSANALMSSAHSPRTLSRRSTSANRPSSYAVARFMLTDDDGLGFKDNPNFKSGFVSILGNANVGKSTLMNSLLGEKLCITSPKPQTTRHRILGIVTEPDEYQLIFSDTPGMVVPAYKLQETMMDTVRCATGDADVIVLVTDVYGDSLIEDKVSLTLCPNPMPSPYPLL